MNVTLSWCYPCIFLSFYHRKQSKTQQQGHANTKPKGAGVLCNPMLTCANAADEDDGGDNSEGKCLNDEAARDEKE